MGDTDWFATKFDIQLQCILNFNYLNVLCPELVGKTTNPGDAMMAIRTKLLTRRRTMSFVVNGVEMIPQPTASAVVINPNTGLQTSPGTVDVENGPKPQSCTIFQLTDTTFLMQYHIVGVYWEKNTINPDGTVKVTNSAGHNVLFNRWSESVTIDNCQYSTFTRDGKYRIRSDNQGGEIVDTFRRSMAMLGVRKGFVRTSSRYTVDPSGLALQYQIEDREVFKRPPAPALDAGGEYFEDTPRGGVQRFGQVRVLLKGGPDTNQALLLRRAVELGTAKLFQRASADGGKGFVILEYANVKIDLFKNEVEFSCRAMMNAPGERTAGLVGFGRISTFTPFVDGTTRMSDDWPIRLRGSNNAAILLRAAAYWDPSLAGTIVSPETGQFDKQEFEVGQAGVTKEPLTAGGT